MAAAIDIVLRVLKPAGCISTITFGVELIMYPDSDPFQPVVRFPDAIIQHGLPCLRQFQPAVQRFIQTASVGIPVALGFDHRHYRFNAVSVVQMVCHPVAPVFSVSQAKVDNLPYPVHIICVIQQTESNQRIYLLCCIVRPTDVCSLQKVRYKVKQFIPVAVLKLARLAYRLLALYRFP